jgi:putative polyhydroxyalkanoate system protein
MPNLTVNLPHQLNRSEAKKRVEEVVVQLRRELGTVGGKLDDRWTGDTLDFGVSLLTSQVTGQAFVQDNAIRIEVVLPWLLAALAGTIKHRLEKEGQRVLIGHRTASPANV